MIRDLLEALPAPGFRSDVCIVGAGAAGIVLAIELAQRGKTVTLLESGGRLAEPASQQLSQGSMSGLPHRGLHQGRLRALGGTTHLWGGQILELDTLDFEERSWIKGSGWPFPKQELTRFYERALVCEDVGGALRSDAEVWQSVGERQPAFDGLHAYVSRWCPEPNFAHLHRKALEGTGIQVWLHSNAVELLMDQEQVCGVRCKTLTGVEAIFKAREYCFCLGAIESSRFFLQPRIGGLPWNHSGLLGKHFQDHIDCDVAVVRPKSNAAFHRLFDAIFTGKYKYNPKLKLDEATQRSHEVLNAGATFYSVSDADEVLSAMKLTARQVLRGRFQEITPADAWRLLRHSPSLLQQTYRYVIKHRAFHRAGAQLRMRVHCEQEPSSRSSISLLEERDELGLQCARLDWRISELEVRTIREFVKVAQQSLSGIAELEIEPLLEAGGQSFLAHCEDSFHHMGGMRMHVSAAGGLVDPDLKLYGTTNAYVCSSAVFPCSGFSNPTHTLLALAARLAEHLSRA